MVRHLWAAVEQRRFLLTLSVWILVSACAQLPKAELTAYTAAFDATRTAAEPMLADYAVAERDVRLGLMKSDSARSYNEFFPTFRTSDAEALSTMSLPPGAAAIDRSFRAVSRYNQTLVALAENRNIEEARGQLSQMIDDLGGIAPPIEASLSSVKPVAQLLVTALSPAIEADNREQFKRIVLSGEPQVQELIDVLRDYTPTQYSITTSTLRRKARQDPPVTDRREVIDKINDWHKAFANYVALLDALKKSLADLRSAVEHPKSMPLLQRAATGASDLRSYADALRLSLAEVRTKR
jgi:hypothetical protein